MVDISLFVISFASHVLSECFQIFVMQRFPSSWHDLFRSGHSSTCTLTRFNGNWLHRMENYGQFSLVVWKPKLE